MPTATERAAEEAQRWASLAQNWGVDGARDLWQDRPPLEKDVVAFFDPHEDLRARGVSWGHQMPTDDLQSLAEFAAALAITEAESWEVGAGDIATRAFEARRFLLGDRVIHWAVPWLDSVAQCYPGHASAASADRAFLLELGEEMRPAPQTEGSEGLVLDGHDSYGPTTPTGTLQEWIGSLWSGHLMLRPEIDALAGSTFPSRGTNLTIGQASTMSRLEALFEESSMRWLQIAAEHPGSAALWTDLSRRAHGTSRLIRQES